MGCGPFEFPTREQNRKPERREFVLECQFTSYVDAIVIRLYKLYSVKLTLSFLLARLSRSALVPNPMN